MGTLAGLLSMVFWGNAIFLAAFASRKIGNTLTLFWMQFFGFIIALFYFLFSFNNHDLSIVSNHLMILFIIALLQVVAYLAFYKGLEKGDVSLVSPIGATWGLVVAILGVIFFREALSFVQIVAIVFIVGGILILSLNFAQLRSKQKLSLGVGVKEGIVAMLGWGISLFLIAIPSGELGWFLPTLVFRFLILVVLLVYILISSSKFFVAGKEFPWKLLLAIGIFDVAGFFSFSLGLVLANASIVAPIASAFALVSVFLAFVFLKEKFNKQKILGILFIVLGLVLISI